MDYKDLSPELREKAKACKTPEELLALAKKEGYKLSDEEREARAGRAPTARFLLTSPHLTDRPAGRGQCSPRPPLYARPHVQHAILRRWIESLITT